MKRFPGQTVRASWGAAKPKGRLDPDWGYEIAVIHHSGNRNTVDPVEIRNEHLNGGFDDVGYHYMVHPDGRIFEGRYLAHKGSHVTLANTGKIGILAMGDFHPGYDAGPGGRPGIDIDGDMTVTPAQEATILMLLRELMIRFPSLTKLGGHRDYKPTTQCPGDLLYPLIASWRKATKLGGP